MYYSRFAEQAQRVEKLLRKHTNQRRAQAAELVLLYQFVQIDTEQLKHKTQVLPVYERVLQTKEMMIIVFVQLPVQLGYISFKFRRLRDLYVPNQGPKLPSCFD